MNFVPLFSIHKINKKINNINMKKILFIVLVILSFVVSCSSRQEQTQYQITNKKAEISQNVEVDYPSVDETIDTIFLENVKTTCKNIQHQYHILPTISYESYINQKNVSYKVVYEYFEDKLIQTYNFDLSEKKEVKFNFKTIINDLNKTLSNQYRFTNADVHFMDFLIQNDQLIVYLSSYLTNKEEMEVRLHLKDVYFDNTTEETEKPNIGKMIAITFDDGPSIRTKEIVDLLDELEIKATFFVLGCNVKNYPEELKYINDHHHEIGNHSYSHPNFKKLSLQDGLAEINQTQEIVYQTIQRYPRIFRFPYGAVNQAVLKKTKLPTILWNADSLDWQCCDTESIIHKIKQEARENGILLFHDFKYFNQKAITTIVTDLKKEGYTFVTVSELLDFQSDEEMIKGSVIYSRNSIR